MKNKTLATWITFLTGPVGLHRLYLFGGTDKLGHAILIPTSMGLYGIHRATQFGLEDFWCWLLIPCLGFTIAGCALNAIVFGLMSRERWNIRFNSKLDVSDPSGETTWLTIAGVVCALLLGSTAAMASLAFVFQRYFEIQML